MIYYFEFVVDSARYMALVVETSLPLAEKRLRSLCGIERITKAQEMSEAETYIGFMTVSRMSPRTYEEIFYQVVKDNPTATLDWQVDEAIRIEKENN